MWKKWCLFHATDFQSLMYPCFVGCRILGTFPYRLNASTFEAPKLYYILSSIAICACCVANLAFAYNIIISKISFGYLTLNLDCLIYCVLNFFIVIITHVLNSPRMRLLQTIMNISSKLPSKSYQKLSRLIHVKDILCNILIFASIFVHFSKSWETKLNYSSVLIGVFAIYNALFELQIYMLYVNCVCVLKACFKRINDNLMYMQRLVVNDIKPSVPRFICQRNQLLLIELKTLQKWHLMTSDAVQMLNIIFSPQLLASTVLSFLVITFELYFFAVQWQDGILISLNRDFLDVLLSTIAYNGIKIMLLAWACETSKNQAQKIITTIHDFLNTTSDETIKYEFYSFCILLFCGLTLQLRLFSLQILHRQNIFSVKGLNIDMKLLVAMVGNITTHLVILIQFLNIWHSCDKKTAINVT